MGNHVRVAIIGGGIAGLTAAFELLTYGVEVAVYEQDTLLGGLAKSFPLDEQFLERYYHFICLNDHDYIDFLTKLGLLPHLRWRLTKMGQYYSGRWFSFGEPWDVLFFSPWRLCDKLRFGLGILRIKAESPDAWQAIEHLTAEEWLLAQFGRRVYETIYKPLIDLKFGFYSRQLSAAWMWARIHRLGKSRTRLLQLEKLGYLVGGTQILIDKLVACIRSMGGAIFTSKEVEAIKIENGHIQGIVTKDAFLPYDIVLVTIPTPKLARILPSVCGELVKKLENIKSIGVLCTVLRLKYPFSRFFWTNISDPRIKLAGIIEYSNLNPQVCNNGDHILYLPEYLPFDSERYNRSDEEIFEENLLYLKLMHPRFDREWIRNWWVFRDQFAQPICTTNFSRQIVEQKDSTHGLYITDSHQLYPDDRTVSNSIKMGRKVAQLILNTLARHEKK